MRSLPFQGVASCAKCFILCSADLESDIWFQRVSAPGVMAAPLRVHLQAAMLRTRRLPPNSIRLPQRTFFARPTSALTPPIGTFSDLLPGPVNLCWSEVSKAPASGTYRRMTILKGRFWAGIQLASLVLSGPVAKAAIPSLLSHKKRDICDTRK
jgi:hypothetical protein